MSKDLCDIEFHHGDILIGIGYNLTENEADKVSGEWENLDVNCWCIIIYRMN